MTTQDILTRVNAAMAILPKDEQYACPGTVYGELSFLARDLEAKLRLECAASKGSTDATRTITKMLNYSKKHDFRESLHYAWSDSQGRQCVADGYRAFRFKEPLPLEPRPENAGEAIDLDKIMPDGKGYAATSLPSAKETRAHIAIERARYTGKRGGFVALWDFGEGKPVVNAHYLLDLVQVFPDAAEIFYGVGEKLLSPLFVRCDAGEAILLPVRASRVVAEVAAARKAREDKAIHDADIDCIEIDAALRDTLEGGGFRVVHDDFLTYETQKRYHLIVMNPPFDEGAEHLLKALELSERGGMVYCILNAETLRNPYTQRRTDLVKKLQAYGAEIEFATGAFQDAERKTDVEVALVRVNIPHAKVDSTIMDDMRKAPTYKSQRVPNEYTEITHYDEIEKWVNMYNYEAACGIRLIEEWQAMREAMQAVPELRKHEGETLELKIGKYSNSRDVTINEYLRQTRGKYWRMMEVASIAGGITHDEEVLTAALLHDTVEDADVSLDMIRAQFGDRVAALVASETEDKRRRRHPAETWRQRKEESLANLRSAKDPGVRALWLSDKLANMRSFARQYEKLGDGMWKDYNQSDPAQQAWYYRTVETLTSDLKDTDAWKELHALNARVFGGVKE